VPCGYPAPVARVAFLVSAMLCMMATACSDGGHSAAPRTTSTVVGGLSESAARARCRAALPGRLILNSTVLAPGTINEIRHAQDAQVQRATTTIPSDREIAVWCWTGRPNDYTGYAIGTRGEVLFTQEILDEHWSTPPAGPAPIP